MSEWKQYKGGRRWRVLPSGEIEVEGQGVPRSSGEPTSMRYLFGEYGEELCLAARVAGVPVPWLAGMIPVESARLARSPHKKRWGWSSLVSWLDAVGRGKGWRRLFEDQAALARGNRLRFDPISLRLEPGYVSPWDTPGRISASLGQVLQSTALHMADELDLRVRVTIGEAGEDLELALDRSLVLLFDPQLVLLCAARYMRWQLDRYDEGIDGHEFDFVFCTGAYNAGSVKHDTSRLAPNPFRLVTFHRWRTTKAIEYHNDCYRADIRALWEGA